MKSIFILLFPVCILASHDDIGFFEDLSPRSKEKKEQFEKTIKECAEHKFVSVEESIITRLWEEEKELFAKRIELDAKNMELKELRFKYQVLEKLERYDPRTLVAVSCASTFVFSFLFFRWTR